MFYTVLLKEFYFTWLLCLQGAVGLWLHDC